MKAAIYVILVVLAAIAPFFIPEAFVYILGLSFLFIILVVSWDVMVGYTGQVNLGHTVFVGVGAYTAALLQSPVRLQHLLGFTIPKVPIFISIISGGIIAALIGFFIGIITLRLKGYYFALVTAILPLVFMQTVFVWRKVFGGEEGFSIGLENSLSNTILGKYYIALIIMVICVLSMLFIVKSQIGLKFKAIREDEELAESIGIDTTKYKVIAFIVSSFFAGIGGAAIIHYRITVSPDLYDIPLMLLIILSAVIGGLGTIYGPVFGAFIIYLAKNWWLKEILSNLLKIAPIPINDDMILYLMLIVVGILMPQGIYVELKKRSWIAKKSNSSI
ncbi:branched-chain amino acid ABC transporter permease [Archaeoglobales archaeon]|nr:MAG: branched-chain amino acid ABC transporter permease [Archaeoglobales archaeon]